MFAVEVNPVEVKIGEPEKCDELGWFTLDNLPSPPHSQIPVVLEVIKHHFAKQSIAV